MSAQSSSTHAYVVELQPGCWIAPWKGDPGRTEVLSSAKLFSTLEAYLQPAGPHAQ